MTLFTFLFDDFGSISINNLKVWILEIVHKLSLEYRQEDIVFNSKY